jgi:hypothetical protein
MKDYFSSRTRRHSLPHYCSHRFNPITVISTAVPGLVARPPIWRSYCRMTAHRLQPLSQTPDGFTYSRKISPGSSVTDAFSLHNSTLELFTETSSLHFDAILVDAPCSGTGVIGRQPDIRWNRQEQDLITYRQKQGRPARSSCRPDWPPEECWYMRPAPSNRRKTTRSLPASWPTIPVFGLTDCRDFLPAAAHFLVR